jgi:hypothetical protein
MLCGMIVSATQKVMAKKHLYGIPKEIDSRSSHFLGLKVLVTYHKEFQDRDRT